MSKFRKGYFSIDGKADLDEIFEGYTDGTTWNGWACVVFTREQMEKWCKSMPYDHRFVPMHEYGNPKETTHVILYFETEEMIGSMLLEIEDGTSVETYYMESYCFVEMKKIDDEHYEPLW